MIKIEITSNATQQLTSKKGTFYYKQSAYAYTHGRDGLPKKYPEEISIILMKDEAGNPEAYQPGLYTLSPQSIKVGNFRSLEIGFPTLKPLVAESRKTA